MKIKDMFAKPIDRDLQGVIKVGDTENEDVRQELEEYVVTKELQKHFADFFAAYKKGIGANHTTSKMGVWISGFFGSGKSHLLKILSYLLGNKEVGGKKAIDYFIDDHKIEDPLVLADMKLAAETPTDVILFNIDSKSDSNGKKDKDAIVNVFLKVFNEMQGFCGSIPYLADLERKLTEEGRYEEFKEKFEQKNHHPWIESRNDFDYIQDDIVDVLADMGFMSREAGMNWCEKAAQAYSISIEDFANRVKKYIESKGHDHHVVFLVDEVGQYIGDDRSLMLNLQTVTEDLGTACRGKAWVIVTSQQDIDSIVKVKGNDFSKIQGRFDTRLALSSANVDEVIKKRILEKNETAAQMLHLLYDQKETTIKNKIVFSDSVERKRYANRDDFAEVYPFIPYQFNLLGSVLTAIRTHGASGKHLSEGERSMLAMFKESAVAYMNHEEGTLIPFYAFYQPMENFLDHSHRSVISKAYENNDINPEKKDDVFAVNVLKTLFLIKYVESITPNIENITTLMISDIDEDRIDLKNKVEAALKLLMSQMLVQKNGESYVFLTNEEQEVNREIENEEIDNAEVIKKVGEFIFDDIYPDKKYRYPKFSGRYTFGFNQAIDDTYSKVNQGNAIGIHILTPDSDITDDSERRMVSADKGNEILVALPNDRTFIDEIERYLKIEKFLRRNAGNSMIRYESIKEAKRQEMKERSENARLSLEEDLKQADIYIGGNKADIKAKDVAGRFDEALKQMVDRVYNKLYYIDQPFDKDDILKLFNASPESSMGLGPVKEYNQLALEEVSSYIAGNSKNHRKTSLKSVRDQFMKAPYGFVEEDVYYLVARLFTRGDISFTLNGAPVSLANKSANELFNYITKKQFAENLMMEQKERVSEKDKRDCKDVMKVLRLEMPSTDDEEEMMRECVSSFNKLIQKLENLQATYYRNQPLYPGKDAVEAGIKLLRKAASARSVKEFFAVTVDEKENLIDFVDDYEPVDEFFNGYNNEQKKLFDDALKQIKIYDHSKVYLTNPAFEDTTRQIDKILHEKNPYGDIHKLPELLQSFKTMYQKVFDENEKPVKDSIESARQRVMEELNKKLYVKEKERPYKAQFDELENKAVHCHDVSDLRGYTDQAETLEKNLFNEMAIMDQEIESNQNEGNDTSSEQTNKKASIQNMNIRSVIGKPLWHIESLKDINDCVETLRQKLTEELAKKKNINIEF